MTNKLKNNLLSFETAIARFPHICQTDNAKCRILYDKTYHLDPQKPLFSHDYWESIQAITGKATGRGTTVFFQHHDQHLILREYLRGGLPGKILTNQFFFTGYNETRAWQEFFLLLEMLEMGLPVPKPLAAGVIRNGLIYSNNIIIERISGAIDLFNVLIQTSLEDKVWRAIGQTIRRFHDHQVYHHDLNIRNILIDEQQKTWLIDFDKCAILDGESWKQKNLDRLLRSFEKENAIRQQNSAAFHWSKVNWETLLQGYATQ